MNSSSETNNELYKFFRQLDRSLFLDNEYKEDAHLNRALPIGCEQTISMPTLVYTMTEKLKLNKSLRVLEIGTGSGYQTTFLAEFSKEVYTIERIEELAVKAQERLYKQGYRNINFKIGDGSFGWAEFAPYDRIIATAGAGKVPAALVEQLAIEGRMLIPVGRKGLQDLLLITKDKSGRVNMESLGEVTFVEFKGNCGWKH